jgi:hypothetical protein
MIITSIMSVVFSVTPSVHSIQYLLFGWFLRCFEAREMSQLCLGEGCSIGKMAMNAPLEATFSVAFLFALRIAEVHQILCVRAHSSFGPFLSLVLVHVHAFPFHVLDHLRLGWNLLFKDRHTPQLHSALLFN